MEIVRIDRGREREGKRGWGKKGGSEKKRQRSGEENCTNVSFQQGSLRVDRVERIT